MNKEHKKEHFTDKGSQTISIFGSVCFFLCCIGILAIMSYGMDYYRMSQGYAPSTTYQSSPRYSRYDRPSLRGPGVSLSF
jgi:hypothetical protein